MPITLAFGCLGHAFWVVHIRDEIFECVLVSVKGEISMA